VSKEQRAREKEHLQQQMLAATRALFVSAGYENVSTRKIAHKIEYAPTPLYLYFKDSTPEKVAAPLLSSG